MPARHDALLDPIASALHELLQVSLSLCLAYARPAPNPFCGAILPTAMCSGWPVNNTCAQPTGWKFVMQFLWNCPDSVLGSSCSSFFTPGLGVGVGVDCWAHRLAPSNTNAMINGRTGFLLTSATLASLPLAS